MKFLFVNLNWRGLVSEKTYKIHFTLPPLDLLALHNLATAAGHRSRILDGFVEPLQNRQALYQWADWIVVTTTPYHMWQCPNSEWDWVQEALGVFPKQKLILAGLHGSVFPEKTLIETGARALIRREPEAVFKEFLTQRSWEETAGVSLLKGGEYREHPFPKLPSLDDLLLQDYAVDISRYGYFLLGSRSGIFESSRGCPWKCTFCDQEMHSWTYRTKSPEAFVEEVVRSVKQTGMQTAYFYDMEFTIGKERTFEICQALIRSGIKLRWACQTRADMVHQDTLEALKAAGCCLIHYGVESANADVLKATNKKISLEKIAQGVNLTKRCGLQTACFFMFGLPGEKAEQFEKTLEFARELNPTYASFHFAIPFPGTPLYAQYLKERKLPWGVWPATYFDGWSTEQIGQFIRRAYIKFYLAPKKFEAQQFLHRLSNLPPKLAYFSQLALPR